MNEDKTCNPPSIQPYKEPIHTPGRIQSHGMLLVFTDSDHTIVQVSANVSRFLGSPAEEIIGRSLFTFFDDTSAADIRQMIRDRSWPEHIRPVIIRLKPPGVETLFDGILHEVDGLYLLEMEPQSHTHLYSYKALYSRVTEAVVFLQSAPDREILYRRIVKVVRELTGFDRVMVYTFDQDWHGQVVAEEKAEGLEPFLGLHYPASDIPPIARQLYVRSTIRLIADVQTEPSPLVPEKNPLSSQPLDLGRAALRAVSPCHIEYLRNMGVTASMSISLVVDDTLVGLIGCHSYSGPAFIPYLIRHVCAFLGKNISFILPPLIIKEDYQDRLNKERVLRLMLQKFEKQQALGSIMTLETPNLLDLIHADGAAVLMSGALFTIGETPDEDQIRQLAEWLREEMPEDVWHSDCLSKVYPDGEALIKKASGILAVAIFRERGEFVIWFRKEIVRTVDWAGAPDPEIRENPEHMPLSPRKSFSLWREIVCCHSKPWPAADIEAARWFRIGVVEAERNRAFQALHASEARLRKSRFELCIQNRIAGIFLISDEDTMYVEILNVVLQALKSPYGYFGYLDKTGDLVMAAMAPDAWEACRLAEKKAVFKRHAWGGVWRRAMTEKMSIIKNEGLDLTGEHVHLRNVLVTPIIDHDTVIGQFAVADKQEDYTDAEQELLEMIAERVAPVLKAKLDEKHFEEERKRFEVQLRQMQKMEAIGTLAGGIAHDFNNILSSILGYTELALEDVERGTELDENLQEVYTAGLRARDLVKQLLTFSRQKEHEVRPVQVSTIAREVLKLLRATIPTTIELRQKIDSDSLVLADPTQMHQIFMNLCTNAVHAMEEAGGTLSVGLTDTVLDSRFTEHYPGLKPGDYLQLTIADTGTGISEKNLEQIFDPYFTTKETGKGTGLGLALVHGVVKSCRGEIGVDSTPEKGTVFTVYLPVTRKATAAGHGAATALPRGTERVLYVDDELPLSNMSGQLLTRLGYTVTVCNSSVEALGRFKTDPDGFDLLITDMTMPEMTGDQLALRAMKIRPDLPVILCTGFSNRISEHAAADIGIKAFLLKPVSRVEMAKMVRRVLDAAKKTD